MKPKDHVASLDLIGSGLAVALLIALFIPWFAGRGEAAAKLSTCLENMKQIGASIQMYAADYDNMFPRTTEEKPKRGLGAHWTYLIQPFVRSDSIFVCPSDPSPSYTYVDSTSTRKLVPRLSYINNYAVIPAHDFFPVASASLENPAMVVIIGERRGTLPGRGGLHGWKGTSGFMPGQPCRDQNFEVGYRRLTENEVTAGIASVKSDKELLLVRLNWNAHGEGANYTFSDGHARRQVLAETLDPNKFEWGDEFFPRSMDSAKCDGRDRTQPSLTRGSK